MKKLAIVLAIVLGMNVASSLVSPLTKMSYAQESPQPEPEKPDKE